MNKSYKLNESSCIITKSALSLILSVVMAVTMIPSSAFAEESESNSPDNSEGLITEQRTGLCVNEICSETDEKGALLKENKVEGGYYDWVEIYNCSDTAINAGSYYLTDKEKKLTKYKLPDVEVASHAFLIIYCGDRPETMAEDEYISGFGISKKGETVYLTDGENIIDSLEAGAATVNKTFSRYPDGGDKVTLTEATPGASNTYTVDAPVLSKPSGFYDPFKLEITTDQDDVTIYYTTDGSTPTAKSKKYTGAISLKNKSSEKNNYSARRDTSVFLNRSLLKKYGFTRYTKSPPKTKMDKANRIKAVCIGSDGKTSDVVSGTYFIGLSGKSKYSNLPIVSIQAPDSELFGYDHGIYVMGKTFASFKKKVLQNKKSKDSRKNKPWIWGANYYNDKEINAEVTYFENTGSTGYSETAAISIKGQTTRHYPQKSFNVKGDNLFFVLTAGGNDIKFKMREPINSRYFRDLDVTTGTYKPCQVFLNGEYWGMYYITDRLFSKKYYTAKYGVNKSSIAIIKQQKLNEGTDQDLKDFKALMTYVSKHDMRISRNYKYLTDRVDINSMIDFYCAEMLVVNTDLRTSNNWAVWRSSDTDNSDGKWRFIIYDTNHTSVLTKTSYNMMSHILKYHPLFKATYKNAEFRSKFNSRMNKLLNTSFSKKNTTAAVNEVYKEAKPYITASLQRYFPSLGLKSYTKEKNTHIKFMKSRPAYVRKHLKKANAKNSITAKRVSNFKVSATKNTDGSYNITVKTAAGTKLDEGPDYNVTTQTVGNNKVKVKVKFTGGFTGSITRTVTAK